MSSLRIDGLAEMTGVAVQGVADALRLAAGVVTSGDVTVKAGRDIVTTMDVAVEDALRTRLAAAFGRPVIGEERGGEAPADGSGYWLVDPICGTRNYASGTPLYCVNLAYVEGGDVGIAVVGDPSRSEILVAERGRGAWALAEGERRSVAVSDDTRTVVIEDGKSSGVARERAATFVAEVVRADRWDLRSLGSTLSLPYLAAGRVSAYVVFYVTAVHSAAGALLAAEAGAVVSDVDGEPWTLGSDTLVAAASPDTHRELLDLLDGQT